MCVYTYIYICVYIHNISLYICTYNINMYILIHTNTNYIAFFTIYCSRFCCFTTPVAISYNDNTPV